MAEIKRKPEAARDGGGKRAKMEYPSKDTISVGKPKKPGGPRSLKSKTKKRVKNIDESKEKSGFISFTDDAFGDTGRYGIREEKQSKLLAAKDHRTSGVSRTTNGADDALSKGDTSAPEQAYFILTIALR